MSNRSPKLRKDLKTTLIGVLLAKHVQHDTKIRR